MNRLSYYVKSKLTLKNAILLGEIACVCTILWFAALPVERAWCQTDISLTYATFFIAAIGVCLLMFRNCHILISKLDMALIVWYFYVMGRAYFNVSYPCATIILRSTQMMMLYIALRLLISSSSIQEKYIVVLILCFTFYEALLGLLQVADGYSRHYLYLLTGTFLNPGPYSIILAMGLVMSLTWIKCAEHLQLRSSFLYIPVIVLTIVLPATWSRAALLSTAICVGITYRKELKRWFWWIVAVCSLTSLFLFYIKIGSAVGRFIIYFISILIITHHPVIGSGIGSFFHQYAKEMARFSQAHPDFNFQSADVLDYAFNDLLRIGVEQGLVGICIAIVVILLTFNSIGIKGQTLRMGFLALLIFSLFSYPFELLPYQIIMTLILAYAGTSEPVYVVKGWKKQFFHRFFIPVGCLLMMVPASIFVSHQIECRAKAETDYQMMAGLSDAAFIDDYYELLPLLTENPRFLFDFGKMLSQQGRYNDSNAMLRQGTLVSNDPMFYVLQGNNYKNMEAYDEAETAYLNAYYALPTRLYPLYQLMCLYEQTGDVKKIQHMAQLVVDFNVKVESPATKEMKNKAIELLKSQRLF